MGAGHPDFPACTAAEIALDHAVQLAGLAAAIFAAGWLMIEVGPGADLKAAITLLVYMCALVDGLTTSAAYHLTRPSRTKELLRRADHAMIYVMIAGSYTPFAVNVLPGNDAVRLSTAVWLLAAIGVAAKLVFPRRFERPLLFLYLAMGWSVLSMISTFTARLPKNVLMFLLLGGIAYTLGAAVHGLRRVRFHNVAWHAMVLVGAGLHLAAVRLLFA